MNQNLSSLENDCVYNESRPGKFNINKLLINLKDNNNIYGLVVDFKNQIVFGCFNQDLGDCKIRYMKKHKYLKFHKTKRSVSDIKISICYACTNSYNMVYICKDSRGCIQVSIHYTDREKLEFLKNRLDYEIF